MINFTDVEQVAHDLKQQVAQGELDERSMEAMLLELIDFAEDGHYWMYGHQSGRWYRHDGKQWHPADPTPIRRQAPILNHHSTAEAPLPHWGWFVASIIILLAIGTTVFMASV